MEKLKYLIKYSPIIYSIYYYVFSAFFRVLGLFVKIDKQLILFNSFGGRKYDDSPKAIFEYMLQDDRFKDYKFVWGLNEPNKFDIPSRAIVVNVNSFKYFIYALKAKIWITNSSIERGLCFKKKDTIYINTWHGTAIKYLGNDIGEQNKSFKGEDSKVDIFFSQGSYDEKVFKSAFCKTNEDLFRFGLPRNDELANCDYETSIAIKKKLNIPLEKKIILYAPTFREYTKNKSNQVMLNVPINFETWQETLGENIVILFRAHYESDGEKSSIKFEQMTIPEWNEEQKCGKKRILSAFLTLVHLRSSSGGTSISSPTYLPFFFRWRTHSVKRYSIWPLTERKSSSAQAAMAA